MLDKLATNQGNKRSYILQSYAPSKFILSLTGIAMLLVISGALIPAFQFNALWSEGDPISIAEGGLKALLGGSPLLGLVILLFSLMFPLLKLLVLAYTEIRPDRLDRRRATQLLELLGKWSMLDVFVIATLVGTIRLGILSEAEAKPGVYVFFAGIFLSLMATAHAARRFPQAGPRTCTGGPGLRVALLLCSGFGIAALLMALILPIAEVDKWVIDNTFHLIISSLEMIANGEILLPLALFVFVIAIPMIRLGSMAAGHLTNPPNEKLLLLVRRFGHWSMLDVYLLALLVVSIKLNDLANLEPRIGLYFLIIAALLERTSHILFQREWESADPA